MNQGISILQGPHHVAQKSSRITFPLNDDSFTSLLLMSFSVKLRFAGFAFAGQLAPVCGPASSWWNGRPGSAFSVRIASARQLAAAMAHRIMVIRRRGSGARGQPIASRARQRAPGPQPRAPILVQRRLHERRDLLDVAPRLVRDDDERTVV